MDKQNRIAILGFGVEGHSIYEYLEAKGYKYLTICDQNVDLKEKLENGVSAHLGENYLHDLDKFDVIFRSPGIKYLAPEVQVAVKSGVVVTSSTAFFMDQSPCKIIGVTGTKGKGTTCTLIDMMLEKAKIDVHLAGNIGVPAIELLEKVDADSVVVLELSSFQLQDMAISPDYAVLLNTTSDHLDYHEDQEEYMRAKENLLANQHEDDFAVLNKDYEYVKFYEPLVKGEKKLVSVNGEVKDGAFVKDEAVYYAKNGKEEKICDIDDIALIGSHNLENVMPAIVIAKAFGVSNTAIKSVIKDFEGLPHRLELVRIHKDVQYYNDSFSTGPMTSMAAVDSFEEPTVLIAGGYDKGLDYNEWALKILTKPSLKTVVLIGDTADKMEQAILEAEDKLGDAEGSDTRVIRRTDFEEAVLEAYAQVEDGGVVVLSPAAASFDMFDNYKERGKEFASLIKKLK